MNPSLQRGGHPPLDRTSVRNYLSSFLLELLDGPLVDAPAFVDEVTCGGGLPGIHMADHHDVDVEFFLPHGGWSLTLSAKRVKIYFT